MCVHVGHCDILTRMLHTPEPGPCVCIVMSCRVVLRIWRPSQELGDTTPFVNSNEPGLKRRCIVMLELSATLARVLEFLTARLPDVFLAGPPLNLSR